MFRSILNIQKYGFAGESVLQRSPNHCARKAIPKLILILTMDTHGMPLHICILPFLYLPLKSILLIFKKIQR